MLKNPHLKQNFSAPGGDESRDGLGVEPGEGEAETPVHGVGRQLERHLSNVVLHLQVVRQVRVLEQIFDGPSRVDEFTNFCRQDSGFRIGSRKFRNVFVLPDAVGLLAADGREADVVFLSEIEPSRALLCAA